MAGDQLRAQRLTELSEHALRNYIALAPFSGPAWLHRYAARPQAVQIPAPRLPTHPTERDLQRRIDAHRAEQARLSRWEERHVR